MALVRCKIHGRVYDDAKDAGCPLCVQDAALPRAPGGAAAREPDIEGAQSRGTLLLLGILVVIAAGAGGVYWYSSTHNAQTRADFRRDSLRALAAAPRGPDTTKYAAPNDLSPMRRARALKGSLDAMLRGGRGAVLSFAAGPIDTMAADRAVKRRAKQYASFAKHWHDRLDAMTRGGTEFRFGPGVRYGEQMEHATNQIQAALSVMRDMVRRDVVKPRSERVADLRAAAGYLNAAGTVLTNLPH